MNALCCLVAPFALWASEAQVPLPTTPVTVVRAESSVYSAQYLPPNQINWYWPTTTDPRSKPLFLHELGHHFDYTTLKRKARRKFSRLFKWGPYEWDREKFAMAYSFCAMGAYPIEGWFGYGYGPSVEKHNRACEVLRWN